MMPVASKTGRATITLRDGRVYVADAVDFSQRRVTFTGRLRMRDLCGERFYSTATRTVALAGVRAIHWHKDEK